MSIGALNNKYKSSLILVFSCLVVLLIFVWQGNMGFSLADEGYLWYGIQRVLLGEVPILDFMSYDPGRYYWSAVLLSVANDNSIINVRATVAVFQIIGLYSGLMLIARPDNSRLKEGALYLLLSTVTLVLWMYPRHKLFDITLSILLIAVLTFLIRNPTARRYIITGICVGFVAVFGRNHGIYGAAASIGVIAWLNFKRNPEPGFIKGFVLFGIGVTVGYLPVIIMALRIQGFADAFSDSIRYLLELQSTNIPIPVPWPWTVNFAAASTGEIIRGILVGIFFMGTLAYGMLSLAWVTHQRLNEKSTPPVFVATSFLALPYAHFAFSRADVSHLAQGIFPLLIGCLVLLTTVRIRVKWLLSVTLCLASFGVMHREHPGWQCRISDNCVSVTMSGKELQVDTGTANDIALLRRLSEEFAPNGELFIATPYWPGAYALLERRSPMWESYPMTPRSAVFQNKEIERIRGSKPSFVIMIDLPLDGLDVRRFKYTHSLVYEFIVNGFEPVPETQNSAYRLFIARQ